MQREVFALLRELKSQRDRKPVPLVKNRPVTRDWEFTNAQQDVVLFEQLLSAGNGKQSIHAGALTVIGHLQQAAIGGILERNDSDSRLGETVETLCPIGFRE